MEDISQISFGCEFHYSKLKPKQVQKLKEILGTKYNGISNEELIKSMPFDVDVYCINPTKRASNPKFTFYIQG